MKDWGTTRSAEKPEEVIIDDYSVWVNSDITEITETDEEGAEQTEYEFNTVQYTKEEYILLQSEDIDALEEEVLTTQEALCEIYESML